MGQPAAEWFSYVYGVERSGNVTEDPHDEFTGKNILYQRRSIADAARQFHVDEDTRPTCPEGGRAQAARSPLSHSSPPSPGRQGPDCMERTDDLCVREGWFHSERTQDISARQNDPPTSSYATCTKTESFIGAGGRASRRFPAFLDDYAFLAQGLLDLYEASFEVKYLDAANELTEKMRELFEDQQAGAFYSTAEGDSSLVMRIKEDYDGAEPSGNSIAILNLLRLSYTLGNEGIEKPRKRP